uniref:Uncharacterized protein n=1 Tax=Arundo donax TaxID=35708 RepID=A0A0A9C3H1_ARUDO
MYISRERISLIAGCIFPVKRELTHI